MKLINSDEAKSSFNFVVITMERIIKVSQKKRKLHLLNKNETKKIKL